MLKRESYPSIFLVTLVDKMINKKEGGKLHTAVSKLTMQAGRYPAPAPETAGGTDLITSCDFSTNEIKQHSSLRWEIMTKQGERSALSAAAMHRQSLI